MRKSETKPSRDETAIMTREEAPPPKEEVVAPVAKPDVPGRPKGAPPQSEVALEYMTRSHHVYKLKNNKKICILIDYK